MQQQERQQEQQQTARCRLRQLSRALLQQELSLQE
jgi:hypothetical protein